jgi:CheY-like chemotaxis protein
MRDLTSNGQHLGRILVVDDEPTIRQLLAEALVMEGYQVLTAANGVQALKLLQAHAVDAILLDLSMPVMDGFGFRRQQLLEPDLARIPLIVLSANHDLAQQSRALRPHAWLSKPFDMFEVVAALGSACASAM